MLLAAPAPTAARAARARTAKDDRLAPSAPVGLVETAIGYRYRSDAIIADEADDGAPGTRLAHVWLRRGEETISSLDLIGRRFVLFAGSDGGDWIEAAPHVGLPKSSCS